MKTVCAHSWMKKQIDIITGNTSLPNDVPHIPLPTSWSTSENLPNYTPHSPPYPYFLLAGRAPLIPARARPAPLAPYASPLRDLHPLLYSLALYPSSITHHVPTHSSRSTPSAHSISHFHPASMPPPFSPLVEKWHDHAPSVSVRQNRHQPKSPALEMKGIAHFASLTPPDICTSNSKP